MLNYNLAQLKSLYSEYLLSHADKISAPKHLVNNATYRALKCDVIKMKFLKLWDLSGYSERTMPKRPICQK